MSKDLETEVNDRVILLSCLVMNEMARSGGKPMNREMLLVFESLQELFGRVTKLEKPGK